MLIYHSNSKEKNLFDKLRDFSLSCRIYFEEISDRSVSRDIVSLVSNLLKYTQASLWHFASHVNHTGGGVKTSQGFSNTLMSHFCHKNQTNREQSCHNLVNNALLPRSNNDSETQRHKSPKLSG